MVANLFYIRGRGGRKQAVSGGRYFLLTLIHRPEIKQTKPYVPLKTPLTSMWPLQTMFWLRVCWDEPLYLVENRSRTLDAKKSRCWV